MCTDAIEALAEVWPADDTPGVTGIAATSAIFAARWAARTGKSMRRTMVLRIYRLSAVTPPSEVPGSVRPASMDDIDLVTAWAVAFSGDTGATLGDVRAGIVHRIAARDVFLWELSGRPVALTVRGPAVGGIVRVNLVDTPPERRRRGYATAAWERGPAGARRRSAWLDAVRRPGERDVECNLPAARVRARVRCRGLPLRQLIQDPYAGALGRARFVSGADLLEPREPHQRSRRPTRARLGGDDAASRRLAGHDGHERSVEVRSCQYK